MPPTLVIDNTSPKPRAQLSNVRPARSDQRRDRLLQHFHLVEAEARRKWTIETAIIWLTWFLGGFITGVLLVVR